MMNRSATSSVTGRSAAMRRMRRRTFAANAANPSNRLFCGTNGCASLLEVDLETGIASCHICGFIRRVH